MSNFQPLEVVGWGSETQLQCSGLRADIPSFLLCVSVNDEFKSDKKIQFKLMSNEN